jgi:translation initiation factor eIF-2B subunit beta
MTPSGDTSVLSSSDPTHVRGWLAANHPRQLALLDQFELELRLGRITTSSTAAARSSALPTSEYGGMFGTSDRRLVTSRTLELLKSLIGSTRWKNAAQLLLLLRGLGCELHSVGGFREPAIGNVVRRIMAAVREEAVVKNSPKDRLSLQSMLWVHPQHIKPTRSQSQRRSDSFSETDSFHTDLPASFYSNRPDLKQAVMEAIQEIMTDLEDLHKNIDEQATDHIHAGEIILTYGRSKTVEMVLFVCVAHWV